MKLSIFISFILFFIGVFSQNNLVQNPGFEEGYDCDQEELGSGNCYFWQYPNNTSVCPPWYWGSGVGTSDWVCNNSINNPLPHPPHSGNAYMGARVQTDYNEYKVEYAISELKESLIPWKEYYFQFFVSTTSYKGDKVGLSFSLEKPTQPCGWGLIEDGFVVENTEIFTIEDGWFEVTGVFIPDKAYKWISVGCFSSDFIDLNVNGIYYYDDLRIWEYCPSQLLIENTVYTYKEYPFEAKTIKAGYDVGSPDPNGNVIVKNGANIIYKAEQYIDLEPGFETEDGAEFLAYIAPCGYMCNPLPVPLAGDDEVLCNNTPITLGFNQSIPNDVQCYWTANPSSMLQFLDDPNSLNPVFTPPNGCGKVTFTLHFTNECAYMASDEITITYNTENTTTNSLSISDVEMDNNEISFFITTSPCTDEVTVEVYSSIDNYSNSVYQKTYTAGIDYLNSMYWFSEGYVFSPCYDYKIKVSSTGICMSSNNEAIIDWPRSEVIDFIAYNYITANGDEYNKCLVFETSAAEYYDIQVFSRWGNGSINQIFYNQSGSILTFPLYTWCPEPFSVADGTYFWTAHFWNSCGNDIYPSGQLYVVSSNRQPIQNDSIVTTPEMIFPKIYPNPATNELFIDIGSYELTKVEIIDVLGRVFIIKQLNEETIQSILINELPEGFYFARLYCKEGDAFTFKFLKDE